MIVFVFYIFVIDHKNRIILQFWRVYFYIEILTEVKFRLWSKECLQFYFLESKFLLSQITNDYLFHLAEIEYKWSWNCYKFASNCFECKNEFLFYLFIRGYYLLLLFWKLCYLLFYCVQFLHQTLVIGFTGIEPFSFLVHVIDNLYICETLFVKLNVSYHVFVCPKVFLTKLHQNLLMAFIRPYIALETENTVWEIGK